MYNGDAYTSIREPDGTVLVDIWENGNFQRLSIVAPAFQAKLSPVLSEVGAELYRGIGTVVKRHVHNFAYMFIHGIAEPSEVPHDTRGREQGLSVSRARADGVEELLTAYGVISRSGDQDSSNQIPRKYAIAYGTGVELYTREAPVERNYNTGKLIGRVDLVFFYTDSMEQLRPGNKE
jgi:hypothetical protein